MRRIHAFIVVLLIACTLSAQSYRIFAGENYKDYIGKWASPYDSESIWNKYSSYGSEYNSKSIWNKYSTYGNSYNAYSPWNPYTNNPPVLVDKDNRIVCYMSFTYSADSRMRELMKYISEHFDEIADDPTQFYQDVIKDHNRYVSRLPRSSYLPESE